MSKGFNPNPKLGQAYSSLKTQIELLIKQSQSDSNLIPIFHTTKKRFAILRQVVNDLAINRPELNFKVFRDRYCCVITETEAGKEGFSYTWVEESKQSNRWLVMAQPPGATRFDSLSVRSREEDARKIALEALNTIRNFPLNEWDNRYKSEYYWDFVQSLAADDENILEMIASQSNPNPDIKT